MVATMFPLARLAGKVLQTIVEFSCYVLEASVNYNLFSKLFFYAPVVRA